MPKRPVAIIFILAAIVVGVTFSPLWTASCSTLVPQAGSEAARLQLQNIARSDVAPIDDALARIETENANTYVAALARLARAEIRLARNDANGAVNLLDSSTMRLIKASTAIDDYAQFMRAEALEKANRPIEARAAFEQLAREYPEALRARHATLRASELALDNNAAAAVPVFLKHLTDKDDAAALLLVARAYERQSDAVRAAQTYRRIFFYAPASPEANVAAQKLGLAADVLFANANADEILARAENLYAARMFAPAADAYAAAFARAPALATSAAQLKRGSAALNARRTDEAVSASRSIPTSAPEHAEALHNIALAFARNRLWDDARNTTNDMRRLHPQNTWTARALVAVGTEAKTKGYTVGANEFYQTAVAAFPNIEEVAGAQFELAWAAHERKDYATSSKLFIEHLANYADKNTDNRGRAGYWAGRDSQLAGKMNDARALYEAMLARYDANWYGYLAKQRLEELRRASNANASSNTSSPLIARAVANLKPVEIAEESATASADVAIKKARQLATINMDDDAFEELRNVSKDAPDSPRINLSIAQLHQLRFEMVEAFNVLRRSFPDYSQMKAEELTTEEWTIFYPLAHWEIIKREAAKNSLDVYNVAGLIRQESVYDSRAKSPANAYGLMQLLLPTAQSTARRAGVNRAITVDSLFEPALNIQLGTAYFRQQLDKFGKLEYVAAAYNAGPGRAATWRTTLPLQIDEWAEAIPFRETRGYVQGIIRNSLQYKRLYDEQGRFRANVGANSPRNLSNAASNNVNEHSINNTQRTNGDVRPRRIEQPHDEN